MTLQLHVSDPNPYGVRNMIYGGPLLRCSSRRACTSCQKPPCSSEETQCRACLNGDDLYCLHRIPCQNWNPSQMSMFYNRQNSYLPGDSQETRSSNYIPMRSSTGQGGAAGAGPGEVQTGDVQEAAVSMPRPHPPPHHHLVSPLAHQTSTPEQGRVRGYCQQIEASPLDPRLSNLLQHQVDPEVVADARRRDIELGTVIPQGTLANISRLPSRGPPAYSKTTAPPRPPPPLRLQSVRPKESKAVKFDTPIVSWQSSLPPYQSLNISQGSQAMSLCQSLATPTLTAASSNPIIHTGNVIPRERPSTDRHPTRSQNSLSEDSGGLAASIGLIPLSATQADQHHYHQRSSVPFNPLESSIFHSPPLGQSHPQIISQSGGGERWTLQDQLLEGGGVPLPGLQLLDHSLGLAGHQSSRMQHQTYTPPILHTGEGSGMHPDSSYQLRVRQEAGGGEPQGVLQGPGMVVLQGPGVGAGGSPPTQYLNPLLPPHQQSPTQSTNPLLPPQQQPPDYSVPIALLIDRIQDLQIQRRSSTSEARIKPTQLPAPKYTSQGQITGLEYYRWVQIFTQTIDRLKLNHAACHAELVTNRYILPQELRTLVSESTDLKTALKRIQSRFPPLSSVWPELYRELSSVQTCNNNRDRIERAGSLISTLTLMESWFHPRDITREDILYVIHRIEGAQEGNLTLLRDIQDIDRLHDLPVASVHHRSYIRSLIERLEHLRGLWSELEASLAIASRKPVIPSVSSFLFSSQPKKKEWKGTTGHEKNRPAGAGGKNPPKKQPSGGPATLPFSSGKKGSSPPGCFICRTTGKKEDKSNHKPWMCPTLPQIRAKQITPPKELCQKCCNEIQEGIVHRSECFMIPHKSPKDGSITHIDRSCPLHSGKEKGHIHQRLCTACGPNLPPPKPRPGVLSFAFRMRSRGQEIQRCAFMTEIISIIGMEGQILQCKVQYDSLGGGNFTSSLPGGFNHGEEGALTEPFTLNTITGASDYCLPLALLMLDTPQRGKIWVEFMMTDFPDGGYLELDENTRRKCAIHPYTEEEVDQCQVRLILGVANALYFPEPVPSPPSLTHRYPGLTLWRSRLSGQILFQGGLPATQQMSSFFSLAGSSNDLQEEEIEDLQHPSLLSSAPDKDPGSTPLSQ